MINVGLVGYLMVLQPHVRLIAAFGPWHELSAIVEDCEDRLEAKTGREPLIVAEGKYRLASALAFYPQLDGTRTPARRISRPANGFSAAGGWASPIGTTAEDWIGEDCIYVVDGTSADLFKATHGLFESVEVVDDPRLQTARRGGAITSQSATT